MSGKSNKGVETWVNANLGQRAPCTKAKPTLHRKENGKRERRSAHGAERIFINVGGRPLVPNWPGLDALPYLTNVSMMDVDFLPEHLIVIGGSYIGLEFGQMYRRFGSRVTIIEMMPRLIAREDEDVSQGVRRNPGTGRYRRARRQQGGRCRETRKLDCREGRIGGKISRVVGTHVLVAIGRRPNTDDLGLDKAGIATDAHGYIQVDDQLRTNVPGIWAMGDCNGRGAFTHTSYNDFEIVAANLLGNEERRVTDPITAYNLYIDPPLGRVGMTEAEVRKTLGRPALIATMAMEDVGRAL